MVNIIKAHIPMLTKARPCTVRKPLSITIHNTGNPSEGAGAKNHSKYMNGSGCHKYCSYNYVVDEHYIIELIPPDEVSWHAGDGSKGYGNLHSISIEICENIDGDLLKATDNAVELVKLLMREYDIKPDRIYQHNHWSGKDCPQRLRRGEPYSWEEFLSKCKESDSNMKYYEYLTDIPEGELRDNVKKLVDRGILRGVGENKLHISEDLVRTITILTRVGVL